MHKKRIKNKDYFYHTLRESKNKTKTIYLGNNKKIAVKRAKEIGLTYPKPLFSFFKHGPFLLLTLSFLILITISLLMVIYFPESNIGVSFGPGPHVLMYQDFVLTYELNEGRIMLIFDSNINSQFFTMLKISGPVGIQQEIFLIKPGANWFEIELSNKLGRGPFELEAIIN